MAQSEEPVMPRSGHTPEAVERTLAHLPQVTDHLRTSAETMPGVLRDLREIIGMTAAATVRVLEETEALVEESQVAMRLLAEARRPEIGGTPDERERSLAGLQTLVERCNDRALAIMSALQFEDVTSQKGHRASTVVEEACRRLARIQGLLDLGRSPVSGPDAPPPAADEGSPQQLADALVRGFEA